MRMKMNTGFLKSVLTAGTMVEIDFSNIEQFDFIMQFFGSEEQCRKELPMLHKLCRNTVDQCRMKAENKPGHDRLFVACPSYDMASGCADIYAEASLIDDMAFQAQTLCVTDRNDRIIYRDYGVETGTDRVFLKGRLTNLEQMDSINIYYCCMWTEKGEFLKAGVIGRTITLQEIEAPGIKSFRLTNPVHKKTGQDECIVVVYRRVSASRESRIDYTYLENINSCGQELYLEVTGELEMADPDAVIEKVDKKNIILRLTAGTTAEYQDIENRLSWNMEQYAPDSGKGRKYKFSFDYDWGTYVPSERLPIKKPVDFYLEIPYMLTTGKKGCLIASSIDIGQSAHSVSRLLLLWGCVHEETLIRMADKSEKKIKDIKIGDYIDTIQGARPVTNIYTGMEETLVTVETKGGHQIVCTADHVVATEKGNKRVDALNGTDRLMTEDTPVDITGIYPCEGGRVYGIQLEREEDEFFFCNGLLSGGFSVQNRRHVRAERPSDDLLRLCQEINIMKKYLEGWKNG